jgi:putative transposase
MKDGLGSIRTGIQGQGGGEVAAAGERAAGGGGTRGWHRRGHAGTLARGCAVQARPRAGLDCGARLEAVITTAAMNEAAKSAWCREHGVYPADLDKWRASCHHRLGRPRGRARQPAGHARRPQADQGARARPAAQGPGAGRDGSAAGAVKKSRGDLQQGRGRMIGLEDRQALAQDIQTAHGAGARLQPACEIAGIDLRTLQRWKAQDGLTAGDGRPQAVRPCPQPRIEPAGARAAGRGQ